MEKVRAAYACSLGGARRGVPRELLGASTRISEESVPAHLPGPADATAETAAEAETDAAAGLEELPCLPRTAIPVRWAVRGEGEAVGGSVRSMGGACSANQKRNPPVIDPGTTAAIFVERGVLVTMRGARSTAYGARTGRSWGRSVASCVTGARLAPSPRCPVCPRAWTARRGRRRRPCVPRRYALRSVSP